MPAKALNRRFFLLQAIMMLIDCITVAYISPILVSFGYSKLQIGQVMTLGALAATLARPLWGFLNDRFSCAKQVTLGGTAVGIACYFLLTWGGGHGVVHHCRLYDELCGLLGSPSDQRRCIPELWCYPGRRVSLLRSRCRHLRHGSLTLGLSSRQRGSVGALDFDVCGCPVFTESSARQPS